MQRWKLCACFVTLTFACVAAHAQPDAAPAQDQAEPQTVVRTYNVADLMHAAGDYPLDSEIVPPTGFGAGGTPGAAVFGGAAGAPQASGNADQLNGLIRLVTDFVDTDSWQDNGGTTGTIKPFGSLLVIAQTEANHARVQQLLDEMRRNTGPSRIVSLRATWIAMPSPHDVPRPGTVPADDWLAKQDVYCVGQTVCFSGQTVHVASGRGRAIVHDLTPIVADSAVAFDPTVQRVQSGVSLQVAAQLVPGTETAIVDLQSFVSEWGEPGAGAQARGAVATTQPGANPAGGAQVAADVDRINVVAQGMKTTLRVPLGKRFVVGGMTMDPDDHSSRRQLCLVIEIDAVK